MNWQNLTDKAVTICRETFGEQATYIPATGSPYEIKGIFDSESLAVDPDTQAVVSVYQPRLGVRKADIPNGPKDGDQVTVREKTYRIIDSHDDSGGALELVLQLV